MSILPRFRVRNLGPISEGAVQLHPLTILIGKNNTGKTYMAQAIYAAYKALERANGPTAPSITAHESEELLSRLYLVESPDEELLKGPLRQKADDWMRARLTRVGEQLMDRLTVYFDVENPQELMRWKSRRSLEIAAEMHEEDANYTLLFNLDSKSGTTAQLPPVTIGSLRSTGMQNILTDLLNDVPKDQTSGRMEVMTRRASSMLAEYLWYDHLLPSIGLDGVAHYLPAGRSGLLEAWTDVVRIRLEQDREGLALTGRDPAALGGIALDFLLELQELTRPSRRRINRSHPRYFGRFIGRGSNDSRERLAFKDATRHLQHLIDGDVDIARGRERVPALTYTQGGKSIPVQRASSMVAELAPLISWIRQLLQPGDLLLIDEPEAHMHPEAIIAVAETLVALSQSGVQVLCTTHSSEFLHQVSNCMLRKRSSNSKSDESQASINSDDIGVYQFYRPAGSSGTMISSVEIDPAWGIPEDEHVAVAQRLTNETATLVDSLS